MFAEFVANHVSAIVATVVLLPVLVLSLAMFVEGVRKLRWPASRSIGTRKPKARRPERRTQPVVAGGAGLRHGIAAPHAHD